jgi:hypothetical protein
MEKTLTFTFEKETKNAVRFKETSVPPIVGTLYVQKWVLAEGLKASASGAYPNLQVVIKTS